MAEKKLTKTDCDKAVYTGNAAKKERCVIWCIDPKGFGLRVTPNGTKSFIVSYRVHGVKKLMAIGNYGVWTVDQARDKAKQIILQADSGEDMLEKRKAELRGETVKDALNKWVLSGCKRKRQVALA